MTVKELLYSTKDNKIWVCPHYVFHPSFTNSTLLRGIECTRSTVPKQLLDKPVRKEFKEGGFLCIVWYNDPAKEEEMKQIQVDVTADT